MKKSTIGLILAVLLAARAHAAGRTHAKDVTNPPAVTFSGNTLQASGVTAGGTVVFYGVARTQINYYTAIVRFQTALTDDDNDGSVTYDIGQPIPLTSVWVVVDVSSGRYAVTGPATAIFPEVDVQSGSYQRNAVTGLVDRFSSAYRSVEMVYILPGSGVWALHAMAGGVLDHGSGSASTTVSITDAAPLAPQNTDQLTQFSGAGTLITFDDSRFDVAITQTTDQVLAGAR